MARKGLWADFMEADFRFRGLDINVKISQLFFSCKTRA